ncbi:hypothetical protein P3X46_015022 [Hevea brasiliensis]|uniref:Agenet domain-containing protein n=1 Tax=Hevea brasiliensis TaxID=3981 RepID=A0ABQ9LUL0_HEVBR|nr:DUF724 domain-containing protein 2 isoform X1 [Hevea brasiliensis]KAJ9171694.1 hypothetical protein P3X46_015022 [Hevea brasiliensis]
MTGLDSAQLQNPQNSAQSSLIFNKGQEVEVSSDDDGFRDAWYVATILESPSKSASKKRKKVMVEYKTLVMEYGSAPLKELVDPGYIRPLPPDDSHSGDRVFQENDVVDARYRDGWWTGVVRKVLERSRYRVYFNNPPDVIDFDGKDLRTHWKWVDANWVAPEKQQMAGSAFSSGTAVEVNIDKENVRDAWFPAVVIKDNGDNTFLVKYQSSKNSDEAGTKVIVDSLHIRPIPPRYADRNFELLEKVDAQYDFGWRAGVITKLLSGRRYNVFFKQGNEDKELNYSEIRPHVEWKDGQWICKSKEVMIASNNNKLLGNAHNCIDSPDMSMKGEELGAIEGKNEDKSPCSSSIRNMMEQSAHCNEKSPSHMLPPSKKVKLAAPNGTGVHSCPSKKSTIEDAVDVPLSVTTLPLMKMPIEISTGETLRGLVTPRTGGKRTRYSKKPMIGDQTAAKTESPTGKRAVVPKANGGLIRIKELPKKSKRLKFAELDGQKVDIVTRKGRLTKSPFRSPQVSAAVDVAIQNKNEIEDKMKDGIPVVIALEAREMRHSQHDCPSQLSGEETLKLMRDQKKNLSDSVGGKIMGLNQHKYVGSSQRRKRGRPRKLVVVSLKTSEAGKEDHGIQDVSNEVVVKDRTSKEVEMPIQTRVESTVSQAASREKTAEVSETDCMAKEVEMAIPSVSKNVADDDQPLSTWIGGMHSSASAEELRLSSGRPSNGWNEARGRHVDLAIVSSVIDAQGDTAPNGNQCLPFVKRSPVWKTIESMEVFQIMPQKPHFQPLADSKEEYREGSAIGIMVTFASLFEKITSLQFDDSKSILESTLESLSDLEMHGFDVTMLRDRVNELLSIKYGKEELLNESKDVGRQIMEHTDERSKLEAKINDIEKKVLELQEELVASKSKMESKDLEITRLQSHMDSVNVQIKDSQYNFEKIASAPWKLV